MPRSKLAFIQDHFRLWISADEVLGEKRARGVRDGAAGSEELVEFFPAPGVAVGVVVFGVEGFVPEASVGGLFDGAVA